MLLNSKTDIMLNSSFDYEKKNLIESELNLLITKTTSILSKVNLILLIIGTIGNILCIYVYSQNRMRKHKFNLYLLVLAVLELLFCLTLSFDYLFHLIHPNKIIFHDLNDLIDSVMDFLINTTDSYIAIITIFISIDRYNAIINPFQVKNFITNLFAKRLIFTSFFLLLSLKIIDVILCNKIHEINFIVSYCSLISPAVFNIFPTIVIFIVNIMLIKELLKNIEENNTSTILNNSLRRLQLRRSTVEMSVCYSSCQGEAMALIRRYSVNRNRNKKSRKFHYIVIICFSLWLVLTTVPYYAINSFYFIYQINIISNSTSINTYIDEQFENQITKLRIIQNISTTFFNSNHFLNFFLYFCFYSNFRNCIIKLFLSIFFGRIHSFPSIVRRYV
jgi:hypothetical protein